MNCDCAYYDLSKKQKEQKQNFMTAALIKSKIKLGMDHDQDIHDDTIMYIAHLLSLFSSPKLLSERDCYIRDTDIEIFKLADQAKEHGQKYHIYKFNADSLLIHLGIFQNTRDTREGRAAHFPKECYISRAKLYYEFAQDYLNQIYRKKTTLFYVYDNLSGNLEKYLRLISETRREYFSFFSMETNPMFSHFLDGMSMMEENILWQKKQDELLDLYSQWLKHKSEKLKEQICKLAIELQIINSDFQFEFPT